MIIIITQGAIIRPRATWYEKGEKNNKYFMNLEKSNKKKSCVRKIFTSDETLKINPKTILSELELFYSKLYKTKNDEESERKLSSLLDDLSGVPMLSEELRSICEGKITYNECFLYCNNFRRIKLLEMMVYQLSFTQPFGL